MGMGRFPSHLRAPFVAALLAVFAALPYQWGGPVWDDRTLLLEGLARLPLERFGDLWQGAVWGHGPGSGYYRPVALMVMALVSRYGIGGLHALALVVHGGNAVLLCRVLGKQRCPQHGWRARLGSIDAD